MLCSIPWPRCGGGRYAGTLWVAYPRAKRVNTRDCEIGSPREVCCGAGTQLRRRGRSCGGLRLYNFRSREIIGDTHYVINTGIFCGQHLCCRAFPPITRSQPLRHDYAVSEEILVFTIIYLLPSRRLEIATPVPPSTMKLSLAPVAMRRGLGGEFISSHAEISALNNANGTE